MNRPHWWDAAVHFGQAARESYQRFSHWTAEVEAELERDWKELHAEAEHDWEHVREAVKEGWHRPKPPSAS